MATIRGGAKLEGYLRELSAKVGKGATVKVGFLEGATYPDGTPVAMVAAIQNFGAPSRGIPPRPFFNQLIADHAASWGPATAKLLESNKFDVDMTLAQVGQGIEGQLRQEIVDMNAPALSNVTLILREFYWTNPQDIRGRDVVAARELSKEGYVPNGVSTKPLVWTGHMLNSISSEVVTA